LLVFSFAGFLLFGVLLVLVGASHADLAPALGLDLEETGRLGASLLLGMGLGVLAAGPMVDRLPRRPITLIAALLSAGALLTTSAEMGMTRAFAHVFFVGMGAGVFETVLNVTAVERYSQAAARYVTFLHSAATVGAMLAPFLIGWLSALGGFEFAFRSIGVACLGLALWSCFAPFDAVPRSMGSATDSATGGVDLRSIATPALLALCAVAFSYIGVEAAVTLFVGPYADALQLAPERGRTAISAFWFGILIGRVVLVAVNRPLGVGVLMTSGLAGGALLLGGVALEVSQVELWVGAVGLAISGIFPIMVAVVAQSFPSARGSATGIAVGSGTIGGFVIPWLSGWLGELASVEFAMAGLALWCLAVSISAYLVRAMSAPRTSA
jgi:FHS family glucose/mannose:H+ symporter-like MFS transporter